MLDEVTQTFFFYDLETSGLNAREHRIMQFAGQRTDMNLTPIGEPYNLLIKLNDDTLPSPEAIMVTGITPQSTQADGYTEAEFAKIVVEDIFTPDTIVVGFNNVRFDDEFIRALLWRNFYDPYEWSWKDGRSRWDLLDVVRTCRALRPDGITWPTDKDGKATNRLELLTQANGITHANAHDALADVEALIAITKLLKEKQPQLFEYLLTMRGKKQVQQLVNLEDKAPFVYVSGRYENDYNKATVAFPLAPAPNSNVLVYDLRYDPSAVVGLDKKELASKFYASWQERQADDFVPLPVKMLQYNHCPAVAPLGVLAQGNGWDTIALDQAMIEKHMKLLLQHPEFAEAMRELYENRPDYPKATDPEAQLYDGFLGDKDRVRVEAVRNATKEQLGDFHPEFDDERLPDLLLHYKARNFPQTLSKDEQVAWEAWRQKRLQAQLAPFTKGVQAIASRQSTEAAFVAQELQLWSENILPVGDDY